MLEVDAYMQGGGGGEACFAKLYLILYNIFTAILSAPHPLFWFLCCYIRVVKTS